MVNVASKWKAVILICIIVPLAFLLAWQVGWIGQPPTETINLEPVTWEFSHPTDYLVINQWQNVSFADNICSLAFSVEVVRYVPPDTPELDFSARIDISGNSSKFQIKTATASIVNVTEPTFVESSSEFVKSQNLSVGYAKSAFFSTYAEWFTTDTAANYTCEATVMFEVVYFNGTDYRRIVQPINLVLRGDRHILQIDDSAIVDGAIVFGVKTNFTVNGENYTTPIFMLLPPDSYTIQAEPSIVQNSLNYSFFAWSSGGIDNDPISNPTMVDLIGGNSNPMTLNLSGDVIMFATYRSL